MIVTGPNANTSFVRNPFVKRKLAETRRYIYPLLPLAGDNFSSKVFVTGELIAFGYNLRWEISGPSVYGSSVSIVREDRKYIQDTVSGSTVFDPFEICGERKFEKFAPFEYSSIFIASVWFKILYSLYAIRRHKFLRSHNRDTIGEISILDSEWANEMTK